MKAILAVLVAVVLAIGGYVAYQDYQFRQVNGRVVETDTFSWGQEVGQVSDDKPVLVYFYEPGKSTDQDKIVSSIAWSYAGEAKVVAVNANRLENLPLVVAFRSGTQPSFVVVHKNRVVRGPEGRVATRQELKQLLEAARVP